MQRCRRAVKMWAGWAPGLGSNGRRSSLVAGDLFHQVDDTATQFGILDAHERTGQREAVGIGMGPRIATDGMEQCGHEAKLYPRRRLRTPI